MREFEFARASVLVGALPFFGNKKKECLPFPVRPHIDHPCEKSEQKKRKYNLHQINGFYFLRKEISASLHHDIHFARFLFLLFPEGVLKLK